MIIKVPKYVADELDGLRKNDLRIQTFKSSGPGGQHRNKVETAVRITHIATGISAESTDSKSQLRNKRKAFLKLVDKLVTHYTREKIARSQTTERIRTYNKMRNVVKDHRTGTEAGYDVVLDGNIDCFIDALIGEDSSDNHI